jgi:hypothetical protein
MDCVDGKPKMIASTGYSELVTHIRVWTFWAIANFYMTGGPNFYNAKCTKRSLSHCHIYCDSCHEKLGGHNLSDSPNSTECILHFSNSVLGFYTGPSATLHDSRHSNCDHLDNETENDDGATRNPRPSGTVLVLAGIVQMANCYSMGTNHRSVCTNRCALSQRCQHHGLCKHCGYE